MKKATIFLASIFMATMLSGQVKGVDFSTTIPFDSVKDLTKDLFPYEQLVDLKNGVYFMSFKQTPTGYERCPDKARRILSDNGKSFSKARIEDDVMYPSNIKGLTDYQNMPHELMMSSAEISIVWKLTDEYHFRVLCNYEFFAVFLIPSDIWTTKIEYR